MFRKWQIDMTRDSDPTRLFYQENAQVYASRDRPLPAERLDAFLSELAVGASILELGCGGGQDSAYMMSRGFDVTATDGSPQFAKEAEKRIGKPVKVLRFEDLEARDQYEGVWAEASLLHVHRSMLPEILERIRQALKKGGVLHASFKSGTRDGHDSFGRYYNYPAAKWLGDILVAGGWRDVSMTDDEGGGYDGEPTKWLCVNAAK
jgi:cyclopropane fatty-acyl-phospholipid synthase-like methyltransferase